MNSILLCYVVVPLSAFIHMELSASVCVDEIHFINTVTSKYIERVILVLNSSILNDGTNRQ